MVKVDQAGALRTKRMNSKRIVFMGTPDFAVPAFQSLLDSQCPVVAVCTQPDRPAGRGRGVTASPVKQLAVSRGIQVLQPATLKDPATIEQLKSLAPDAIVVVAYGQLLPRSILDIPRYGCLNIHPSLLPRHRGASPIPWAILEGDEVTGVSIMLMDTGMDTGPVLAQEQEHILQSDTTPTLSGRLASLAARLLTDTLSRWFSGSIPPQPQDNARATYSRIIQKEDGEIPWERPATEISRRIRAFLPWPACYTWYEGKMLKVLKALPLAGRPGCVPGRVVPMSPDQVDSSDIGVETGDGVLALQVVQIEGKKEMPASVFARGARGFVGSVLPSGPTAK